MILQLKLSSFKVSNSKGFEVSKCQSLKVSKLQILKLANVQNVGTSISKIFEFWNVEIYKRIFPENELGGSCICWSNFSKVKTNWFWASWTCPLGPKIVKMKTVGIFGKWKSKITSFPWREIIIRSFCAFQNLKFKVKWPPRPRQTPNRSFSIEPL